MKHILDDPNFICLKNHESYPMICHVCSKSFLKTKGNLKHKLKNGSINFMCSKDCVSKNNTTTKRQINCTQCNIQTYVFASKTRKNKSGNYFCSLSCSATYNNTHKKFGNRRSKLEKWIEEQLNYIYPNLKILYSNKEKIKSELDIYLPTLNLAFELNGIYHYEAIHGTDKLNQIQNNDQRKFQLCLDNNIELHVIDTSQHKYVKPSTNQKYLDIIQKIINIKI